MRLSIALLLILGLALVLALSQKQVQTINYQAPPLISKVVKAVEENHINTRPIDDKLSSDMYHLYLKRIDPNKEFLTQEAISELGQYEFSLDEELLNNSANFFMLSFELLNEGMTKANTFSQAALKQAFDFSLEESLETNPEKLDFAEDDEALAERWRKKVKLNLLDEILIEDQSENQLAFEERQARAIKRVKQILIRKFQKQLAIGEQQLLEDYANSFLKVHDYQSEYLSPKKKEEWDNEYTRSFVGIGVQLEIVNEYVKIKDLIIGGPAWKSNQLATGDLIYQIVDGDKAVEASGRTMEEVVKLLKGEVGSEVRLNVKKSNDEIKEVSLKRAKVDYDLAMSFLLEDKLSKEKIGYIRLPRFYGGDEGCASHVLAEIEDLKKQGIDGLIFDLRNNTGGASRQAIEIIGYFLEEGNLIQMEYQDGSQRVLKDPDDLVQFDGQLIVLVNSRSGSASELMAGNMQDYGRALIVGSKATFGKGSMQNFVDLSGEEEGAESLGQVKLSVGRFYTGSGRSPQYTGIASDLVLPDKYAYVPRGERAVDFALEAKDLAIEKVSQEVQALPDIAQLKTLSEERRKDNIRFQLIEEKAKAYQLNSESTEVSLNYESYRAYKKEKHLNEERFKSIFTEIEGFKANVSQTITDSAKILKRMRWQKKIEKDPFIYECFWIMNDMIG